MTLKTSPSDVSRPPVPYNVCAQCSSTESGKDRTTTWQTEMKFQPGAVAASEESVATGGIYSGPCFAVRSLGFATWVFAISSSLPGCR